MLAAEDLPIPGILGHLVSLGSVHANVRTFLAPWRAVQAAAGVFLVAAVVFVLFLKKVGDSNMDSLFKFIFRLQATQSLVNSAFILAGLIISAVNSTDGPARVLLCRLVASAGISLNVGFVFSMLVVALIRVAYIFFPIYIHSLPTAVLQVAISTGWLVVVAGFFAALYEEEVWSVQGLYYCLGLNADDIDHPMMLTVIFPVMNALTVLAYVFILVQQFTRKIPRRRHQVFSTLSMSIVQFLLQILTFLPFVYFNISAQVEVIYFRVTLVYYAMVESVVSPAIMVLVMRFGDRATALLGRVLRAVPSRAAGGACRA